MTDMARARVGNRLSPTPSDIIDRSQTIEFTFNGRLYSAHPGDTIASALAAAGVKVFSRSFKYHRPRGLLCCAGHCPNCLVQVETAATSTEPNVRACTRPVEAGMDVNPQNAWPSLDYDVMSLTALGDRFLPVGFYYKTFIRPQFLWPAYEHVLRHSAGLGHINPNTPPGEYDKQYLHADVAIVGAGPAGLSAAQAAAQQGAQVLLFDENPHLGGHLQYSEVGNHQSPISNLQSLISNLPNLTVYTNTTVLGWYEDNWLAAVCDTRLYKIRARAVVLATGAYEQPLVFDNNDLPGVMLGSGVQRLLHLYGVAPGRAAVVITAGDDGWAVAADLQAAGIPVAAVADQRLNSDSPLVQQVAGQGAAAYWSHTITAAEGSGQVGRAVIAPVDEHGQISTAAKTALDCDLIAVCMGWAPANGLLYQAGGQLAYNHELAQFVPLSLPGSVFAAGRVTGIHHVSSQIEDGRQAGLGAAAYLGITSAAAQAELDEMATAGSHAAPQRQTAPLVRVPGQKKRFVCFCEDVTDKDVEVSIAEGYDSLELLKRYSTISMGPCQGKMCSLNTLHLCARLNGWTIEQTGTTTARPPLTPVSLGALAGQNMEPVQLTPVHHWHQEQGANMMVAGLWLRPEHYGDPQAEVQAVRQRAGLIDVSTLGKLRLTGPGVPDLLDRLYVNKWQKLGIGRVRYGLMCNDEGVILDDGVTARVGEHEWYTTTTSSGAGAIYEWIQWWIQSGWGESVHVTDVTEVNAAFNLAGPQSRAVLQKLTVADVSNEAFPYLHLRDMDVAGVPGRVLRIGFTGELAYEIHCPAGYGLYLWQALLAAGAEFGLLPFGVEAQRVLRLEKAHIIAGQDTDAMSDPIAADMAWAVKLDKSDFLGQRTLQRVAESGSTQWLVGFKMAHPGIVPEEGLQIVRPAENTPRGLEIIGWVTSCRHSPTLAETIGLCWLPAELAQQPGATFNIYRDGELLEAHVHHGPFYDPDGERLRM